MTYKLSSTSKQRLAGVNPVLIGVINRALTITTVDFGIPRDGGLRTAQRQNELYQQGRTEPGSIITTLDGYVKKSNHQTGNAFDVFAYVDGKASWDEAHLTAVATAILASASQLGVPMRWGGHFKSFKDLPHFEVLNENT